jgi:aspartyl-tRNA(Asn)/glutamyl-tRNA(Gln) amidotransferase subunit C
MTDMAKLTPGDVLKLAQLARLSISDEEVEEFVHEFEEILTYVEQLQSVDTDGLEPTNQVSGNVNVMREDAVIDYGYEPRELLKNLPNTESDQIKVKRMVG